MKTLLLYRDNDPSTRQALDYQRDFTSRTGKKLLTMDPESPEGVELCRLYDILQFPAILVRDDSGGLQNLWIGDQLPTFSELSIYVEDENSPGPV